jgi:hypothetical protein
MIPSFIIIPGALWPILPAGVFDASIDEVEKRFATTDKRRKLFVGLTKAVDNFFLSGCPQIFLDGSFVTAKPDPSDYDALWDPRFVDPALLDPVFLDFTHGTDPQKTKYLGEFFPVTATEGGSRRSFFEFFQIEKQSGSPKGIIRISNHLKGGGKI